MTTNAYAADRPKIPPDPAGEAHKDKSTGSSSVLVALALLAWGAVLLWTNRFFAAIDDECAIVDRASQSIYSTVALYLNGIGEHEHPPLYDILLHGWLRLTGGNASLVRLPSIFFYICGAWVITEVARRMGGAKAQLWVLGLVVVWPFGFHFGRLATWYSFSFLLVSLLTWQYERTVKNPEAANWVWLVAFALALVYSNYFGWALLACLGLDYAIRVRQDSAKRLAPLVIAGGVLAILYIPLFAAFLKEVHYGVRSHSGAFGTLLLGIYNLYCIFVSESVAPWVWVLGIPASTAIFVCVVLLAWRCPSPARNYFFYFLGLLAAMTVLGIVISKRLLLISPWLILPAGVALASMEGKVARRTLMAALALIFGIGWYGIVNRNFYAAPHWVEPWPAVADRAANVVRNGGVVIGNNPSLFFHLTYLLPMENVTAQNFRFAGLLPNSVRTKNVYDPQRWLRADQPTGNTTLLIKGLHYGTSNAPTETAEQWLETHCAPGGVERFVHDSGALWKQRFVPGVEQPEWRVEVRAYNCR